MIRTMTKVESFGNLLATKSLLKASLENSTALALALDKTEQRIVEIDKKLVCLEAAIRPSTSSKNCTFAAIRDNVSLALGPAVAVLKILNSIHELKKSLMSAPGSDLSSYLSTITQLEEALKFLTSNCSLAIQWLGGVVEFLEENSVPNERYILNVKRSLMILQEIQATEGHACLNAAFDKLEFSFKQILTTLSSANAERGLDAASLRAIVERLNGSNRLANCISTFIEARSLSTRYSLDALEVDYLENFNTEFDESLIDDWSKHMEFIVRHVLEYEHNLCKQVFGSINESDVWIDCYAKIAKNSGILSFLQFGISIAESHKSPIKLLNLLRVFSVLENLRMDFNKLFKGEVCIEIKTMTTNLVSKVVDGANEIFRELPLQVELERQSLPTKDGSVPRLVSFVTEYCNQLLNDHYRPILTQVLKISQVWRHEKYEEGILTNQIYRIVREVAVNLDVWSKAYEQRALCYIFMMNNHSHFHSLKGTKLGDLMGDSWLNSHGEYKEYYSALYLRESWGKLLTCLSHDDLRAFNEAFEDVYRKQSSWVILDQGLRQKMQQRVVQALVPAYRSCLQKLYSFSAGHNQGAARNVIHTVQSLEEMLSTLFQPKQIKFPSNKDSSHFAGKQRNAVTNYQFRSTLAAM